MIDKNLTLENGMKITLREAIPVDAGEMIKYLASISGESDNLTFGPGEMKISIEDERSFIEKALESENQLFLVVLKGNKIIGNLHFESGIRPRITHAGEFGVSVLKDFWGRGIATILITAMIEWAGDQGKTKINLKVRADNDNAISLYKKLGFEEEGVLRRDFLINGKYYDSVMMGFLL